jgi:hypothetical protein
MPRTLPGGLPEACFRDSFSGVPFSSPLPSQDAIVEAVSYLAGVRGRRVSEFVWSIVGIWLIYAGSIAERLRS